MTTSVQEHSPERFSCTLEKVPRHHAEGNHKESCRKNAHGPGRKLDELGIVRGEGGHEGFGLPHENSPRGKHEAARINKGEFECILDAVVKACSVIVTDNRLSTVHKSEERQNDNAHDAVGNAEGRNRHVAAGKHACRLDADVSVGGKAPGQDGVHQAVANLHHGRRQTENINLAHVGGAQLHVAPANANGGALLDKELGNECRGHKLRTDGRPGGALDTPMELHNKEVVEDDVRDGTRDFTEHGGFGVPHRTDKVVHAGGDCLENGAAQQNAHVAAGHG